MKKIFKNKVAEKLKVQLFFSDLMYAVVIWIS